MLFTMERLSTTFYWLSAFSSYNLQNCCNSILQEAAASFFVYSKCNLSSSKKRRHECTLLTATGMSVPAVMLLENKGNLKWGYLYINSSSNFSIKVLLLKCVWFLSAFSSECFSSCNTCYKKSIENSHFFIKSVIFSI